MCGQPHSSRCRRLLLDPACARGCCMVPPPLARYSVPVPCWRGPTHTVVYPPRKFVHYCMCREGSLCLRHSIVVSAWDARTGILSVTSSAQAKYICRSVCGLSFPPTLTRIVVGIVHLSFLECRVLRNIQPLRYAERFEKNTGLYTVHAWNARPCCCKAWLVSTENSPTVG